MNNRWRNLHRAKRMMCRNKDEFASWLADRIIKLLEELRAMVEEESGDELGKADC